MGNQQRREVEGEQAGSREMFISGRVSKHRLTQDLHSATSQKTTFFNYPTVYLA
jgi:hypothetical protein